MASLLLRLASFLRFYLTLIDIHVTKCYAIPSVSNHCLNGKIKFISIMELIPPKI